MERAPQKDLCSISHNQIIKDSVKSIGSATIIKEGKSVLYKGAKLALNKFICTSYSDNLPVFGKTSLYFSANAEVYAVGESFNTLGISENCLGYIIEDKKELSHQNIRTVIYEALEYVSNFRESIKDYYRILSVTILRVLYYNN